MHIPVPFMPFYKFIIIFKHVKYSIAMDLPKLWMQVHFEFQKIIMLSINYPADTWQKVVAKFCS